MKRILSILALIVACSISALAQTHSASVAWTPSTSAAVVSQNIYRANCAGTVTANVCSTDSTATFTKLAAGTGIAASAISFTDSTVAGGQSYIWYVTAVCPATGTCQGESLPSNHIAATIPGTPPPPPTGLSILSVAVTNVNGQDRLQADWTDANGTATAFTIFGGNGQVLKQGSQTAADGVYSYAILVPVQSGVVSICDAQGCAIKTFAGI